MNVGGGQVDGRGEWGYPPRRPFLLLAVYFLIGAAQLALTVVRPPLPDTPTTLNLVLAVITALQALVTILAGVWLATGLLPYIVATGILVAAVSAAGAAGGQGQLIAGFYLAILGLFSGYFLSWRAVRLLLVLAVVGFGAALVVNFKLDSWAYILAIVVLVVGVTLVVSSLVQHLRDEAVHDPLTGALNRRGLQDAAKVLHDLDLRHHVDTTVVEIDLNGFKAYNDTHGHQAGDQLLAEVVTDWASVLRRTDILSRTGGDEFVLLLPSTSVVEADALIARMRSVNPVSWSAGIIAWGPGESLPVALDHADEAMYRDKSERRGPNAR